MDANEMIALSARRQAVYPVRPSFVARFGELEAGRIEAAAEEHANGLNSANRGSDPFKWAIVICIGYDCAKVERFRQYHKIEAAWADVADWIKVEGDLATHDGDVDYLSLFAGSYQEFVTRSSESASR